MILLVDSLQVLEYKRSEKIENIKQDEVIEVFNGPVTRSFKARHKLKLQMTHLEEPLITSTVFL